MLIPVVFSTLLISGGCSSLRYKSGVSFPKDGFLTQNAVVKNVKDVEEKIKFKGPVNSPEVKKVGNIVVKTYQDKEYIFSSDLLYTIENGSNTPRNSTEYNNLPSVGQTMTIYSDENGVIGACLEANEYLERKKPKK